MNSLGDAITSILEIQATYLRDRTVFIEGGQMIDILTALGATDADLATLPRVSNGLSQDPTLPFRKTKNGRFCFDHDNWQIKRLELQPFVLSAEDDFVRHDSGKVRSFEEIGDDLQLNSALQALLVFKCLLVAGMSVPHRPKLNYESNKWVCTLFHIRTVTDSDLLGEPALEGVHSDGVDHTMTTFLGSENMTSDSAITFIHDMQEKNGTRWNDTDSKLVLGKRQHRSFLDTLLIIDHERKHSLSPVFALDKQRAATRDMLIFFTRKPVVKGHISHPYDSLNAHEGLPMSIDLPGYSNNRSFAVG